MARVYSRTKTCWFLRNLFILEGSVFPQSFVVSVPAATLAAVLVHFHTTEHFHSFFDTPQISERIISNSAIWSGFTFLVSFLVVFRTSHGYNRYWEACASVHKMGAEWFDSCSALIAYTKVSTAEQADVVCFQNKVIRLFSLLHAVALAELEDLDNGDEKMEVRSFEMELVDAAAFDDATLAAIRDSTCRVELVYQWIQTLIVDSQFRGILSVPAPILTRSFQELSGGMVCFHDALKVAETPFPFPYSQTCDILLFFLYITAPFVVSSYCSQWWLAFFFTFFVIFTLACLTLTGLELEFPFGRDANDIQGIDLQLEMNLKLRLLVSKVGWRQPQLKKQYKDSKLTRLEGEVAVLNNVNDVNPWSSQSLAALWEALPMHNRPVHPAPGRKPETPEPSVNYMARASDGMRRITGGSVSRQGGRTLTELKRTPVKVARRCEKMQAHRPWSKEFNGTYLTPASLRLDSSLRDGSCSDISAAPSGALSGNLEHDYSMRLSALSLAPSRDSKGNEGSSAPEDELVLSHGDSRPSGGGGGGFVIMLTPTAAETGTNASPLSVLPSLDLPDLEV